MYKFVILGQKCNNDNKTEPIILKKSDNFKTYNVLEVDGIDACINTEWRAYSMICYNISQHTGISDEISSQYIQHFTISFKLTV